MGEVKFGHGYAWRLKKGGKRENIDDLREALKVKADCGPCGCDDCYGHWTQNDAETGELMAMWIQGGVLQIDTYDNAIPVLKQLYKARTE